MLMFCVNNYFKFTCGILLTIKKQSDYNNLCQFYTFYCKNLKFENISYGYFMLSGSLMRKITKSV